MKVFWKKSILKKTKLPLELFWRKSVLKNNFSESCQVKLPGKILEKIPWEEVIF